MKDKICVEKCEAAKGIEAEFGTQKSLEYSMASKRCFLLM